ncbi:uncharacterized protein LOC117114019 [Anneissia japonica]|uniref:uncharacterized protein LOC117114019 n=1 Tax=Anneissia japonica TaxID=1529436 RepID=UPI0014256352|nr:uncharacterized protein LOC117114019 [Anneissia japonica]XP_033113438.1 uncharacterized protein LOC117114019 [Anneissia japonica]XP_033113439.1 uncharacterized protein LOC117114019 [Anneissia japonica]
MNIEIKIPGYSGSQPTVSVTQPTSLQTIPVEYNVNVPDSSLSSTDSARPITSQTYRQQTTYVTPPQPIINTSHTRNIVTSTSKRTQERDIQVVPVGQDATTYRGYYTTPVTVTSSKNPDPKQYIIGPQGNPQMSLVQYDNRSFQATMDLSEYSPQEIQVKVKDRTVTVNANHREANNQGGFTQRSYSRQYTLPDDVNPNMVKCFINEKGELAVEAPRFQPISTHDRVVPIEMRFPQISPPPTQHTQPLIRSVSRTSVPPQSPPSTPQTITEQAPKRPPRPTNYGGYHATVNKPPPSTPPPQRRTPTVSFRATNDIDSGKRHPPTPEVVNERQTPFVEDVTSDVESQKIDFKSAKKMFEN